MSTSQRVSCGILVFAGGRLLLARPSASGTWDVPKGVAGDGEDHLAAALRELEEETGISLAGGASGVSYLIDTGVSAYLPGKDLRLYAARGQAEMASFELSCSVSLDSGEPEIAEHAWVDPFDAPLMVGRNMGRILSGLLPRMDADFWLGAVWPRVVVPGAKDGGGV